ncbi:uncharacterized protein LOC107428532 isoform X3 [Ziziphus jujuba]|uniref:Uncharacterized protein LOC107428532 isoform X3 n=1 Tax=Ziziphus jujuba TaxID=326968 RepID=A0ABM4AGC6_ZIZJJ|nr:uncharacterized protein LOC107428532 isoform X3 [Ziziphus jujuba]
MAFRLSLQLPHFFNPLKSIRSENRQRTTVKTSRHSSYNTKENRSYSLSKKNVFLGLIFRCYTSTRWSSYKTLSSIAACASSTHNNTESGTPVANTNVHEIKFNRVNCLVRVLHESAKSFSLAVESLELIGNGPELAMAWIGKDVHRWHKRIAYLVAVYALLKTAIEVEVLLSHERHCNNSYAVREILTPKINLIGDHIESQLNMRHSKMVEWFRVVELPRVAGFFVPLLNKWSMEYAGSGVAGMVVAISCCAAVGKLSSGHITCPFLTLSVKDVMIELMDLAHSLELVEKLHQLATEAGFELDFLSHFGKQVISSKRSEELEFWIGLAQKKLSIAFCNYSVHWDGQNFHDKIQANTLATFGLFAYLGRSTRLFLSRVGIKDVDEPIKDFLSYLECGILFIYPEFSSMSVYQSFMEVVTDEIGWLNFYVTCPSVSCRGRRRSKQHAVQAEKEIVLSIVFTICYDVFSGFAHFNRSTQQLLDADLLAFLLQSQSLLTTCLEDYWAVYDKSSSELLKITETGDASDPNLPSIKSKGASVTKLSLNIESQQSNLLIQGCLNNQSEYGFKLRKAICSPGKEAEKPIGSSAEKSDVLRQSLLKKYSIKLASASSDIWMGTELLYIDITTALKLLLKQFRGHKVTMRERNKLKRTLNDFASLIPISILMLIPVSAVGHAAMLAAINKYMPQMIPSPYSSERLDVVKQLKRTKKMEISPRRNVDDPYSKTA